MSAAVCDGTTAEDALQRRELALRAELHLPAYVELQSTFAAVSMRSSRIAGSRTQWPRRHVFDLFSRRVVGWAIRANNDTALALAALHRALRGRRFTPAGLLHHTDRGSPYASDDYRESDNR